MEPDRWAEVKRIVNHCLEENPPALDSHIQEACGGDAALVAEVRSLLSSYAGMGEFLTTSVIDHLNREPEPGDRMGPYAIRSLIGEGGMGRVYLATRVTDFEKPVAIKLVKRGMDTELILRRFRTEQQILARLDHPGIARLLDGGVAEDGRPYLVMEYVEGHPITQYCADSALSLRERLQLFRAACSAVQYAHQNLVIHRDLKPSNILVTNAGVPKLLDFGIAKLLEPDADTTLTSVRIMTPECASPEQVRGEPVTTATDVYALGALLYQLLTGEKPYEFESRSPEAVARVVCGIEPKIPSTIRPIARDLDKIVLKAMHKDPARRYAAAAQLSEDIRRYLAGLPISARKDTFSYRASKFIARNKAATSGALLFASSLVLGMAATAWEAHVANSERTRAERRFNDVRQLARSVIFDLQSKLASLPGTTEVRKELASTALAYLDGLSREAGADLGLQKELAEAYERVGDIQGGASQSLGDWQGALVSLGKAERITRQMLAQTGSIEASLLLTDVLSRERNALLLHDRWGEAESYAREALQLARKSVAREPENEGAQSALADALGGISHFPRDKKPSAYWAEAARIQESLLSRKPADRRLQRDAALKNKYLAGALLGENEIDGAYPYLKRAADLDETLSTQAFDDPVAKLDFAIDLGQLGDYYWRKKKIELAIQFTRRSLALRREIATANPKDAWAQSRLAYGLAHFGYIELDRYPREALALFQEAVRIDKRPGGRPADIAGAGAAWRKLADEQRACKAFAESVELFRALLKAQPKGQYPDAASAEKGYAACVKASIRP